MIELDAHRELNNDELNDFVELYHALKYYEAVSVLAETEVEEQRLAELIADTKKNMELIWRKL